MALAPRSTAPKLLLAFVASAALLAALCAGPASARKVAKHAGLGVARVSQQQALTPPSCGALQSGARISSLPRRKRLLALRRCGSAPASESSLYWGAWIGEQLTGEQAPWDMSAVTQFEQIAQKPLSLINFSSPFADCSQSPCSFYGFPQEAMENVRTHGAIPFFSWASNSTPTSNSEPEFQLADVIEGRYDSYIREWATAAKAWGHPFFLRFNWEMNGDWFPWAEGVNGNSPGEYVDWTCLDGYNWGQLRDEKWRSFDELFGPTYDQVTEDIAPSKPMVIGEVGSTEQGGSKAAWISEMLRELPTEFPQIKGVQWFEKNEDGDWPIESSASAASAFAAGISRSNYLGNRYAELSAAPVPSPS